MELTRTQKLLLGVASAWPLVYMFLFVIFIFLMIGLSAGAPGGDLGPIFGGGFVLLFLIHILTIFLTLGLTVVYIIHAVKNTRLDSNMRIVWIILFFFGGMIAHPVYWYLQIWKEPLRETSYLNPLSADSWFQKHEQDVFVPSNEPPDWR